MQNILVLGNEFIQKDSLAKKIIDIFPANFNIIEIKDSFQLMTELNKNKNSIILDVVQNLKQPQFIKIKDLKNDSILSAHDFDAGYILKLFNKNIKIIGIPTEGNIENIQNKILNIINQI